MKIARRILLGLAVAAVAWGLWQHYAVSEETRVRRVLEKMTGLVERGEGLKMAAGLSDCIAQDYSDRVGLNKTTLIEMIIGYRHQFESVSIYMSDLTLKVDGATAETDFAAKVVGSVKGSATPSAEQYSDQFHLTFKKTEVGWQMTSAEGKEQDKIRY